MAFEKEITLKDCLYSYAISDNIKKYNVPVLVTINKFESDILIKVI